MSRAKPILVTIAWTADLSKFPLGLILGELSDHYEVRGLVLGEPTSSAEGWVSLDELGLPAEPLRFALEVDELSSYAKPAFLARLLDETTGAEIIFVDAGCLAESSLLQVDSMERFSLELFSSAVGRPVHPRIMGWGVGATSYATGDLLRLRASDELKVIMADWQKWLDDTLLALPNESLQEAEALFLGALPAATPVAGWNHQAIYRVWSDVAPDEPRPPLIGTRGLGSYLDEQGIAVALMRRRTSRSPAEDIVERFQDLTGGIPKLSYTSGEQVHPLARAIFRSVDPWGHRWPNPFDDHSTLSFRHWLLERDTRGMPRFAQALYWARYDLRESFELGKITVEAFCHWLSQNGVGVSGRPGIPVPTPPRSFTRRAVGKVRRTVGAGPPKLGARRRLANIRPGLNVVGFLSSESGLGHAVRGTAEAVRQLGLPLSLVDLSQRVYSHAEPRTEKEAQGAPFDVTIFHLNPPEMLDYCFDSLAYRLGGSWHVGSWAWETDRIPQSWRPALDIVDEIWVSSTFVAKAVREATDKPITVMWHPVDSLAGIGPNRRRFVIPEDAFTISFVADAYSSLVRKNPLGVVAAFRKAFAPNFDGVHLVLKVSNLEKFPGYQRELEAAIDGLPVSLLSHLKRRAVWELMASSDVYLSLHASEGFGLTCLEAMSLGVPVIATAYGGNMDFMDESNSLLVQYDLVPAVDELVGFYKGEGRWARPDTDHAAALLRALRDESELSERLKAAGPQTARRFSHRAYSEKLRNRLVEIGMPVSLQDSQAKSS